MNVANDLEVIIQQKKFTNKNVESTILNNVVLSANKGDTIAIVGDSGSGKTTLLNIVGLLDNDFIGSIQMFGQNIDSTDNSNNAFLRNSVIGFVLQDSMLIKRLTVLENILLPVNYNSILMNNKTEALSRVYELAKQFHIEHLLQNKPTQLSGGQQQRVGLCRALLLRPVLILADEPTASLDYKNSTNVMESLLAYAKQGAILITVTHNQEIAHLHSKILELSDGNLK